MNRGWASIVFAAILLTASLAVQAQDYLTPKFRSLAPGSLAGDEPAGSFDGDALHDVEEQHPWRISSGFEFTPFVSLELGYQNFGNSTGDQPAVYADGWSLSGLLSVPLESGLSPYARLGQMFWGGENTLGSPDHTPTGADGSRDLYYGLGLRYGLAEQLDLQFEYERFTQDETQFDLGSMNLHLSF